MKCWISSKKRATCSSVPVPSLLPCRQECCYGLSCKVCIAFSGWAAFSHPCLSLVNAATKPGQNQSSRTRSQLVVHAFIFGWFPYDRLPKVHVTGSKGMNITEALALDCPSSFEKMATNYIFNRNACLKASSPTVCIILLRSFWLPDRCKKCYLV